LNPNRTVVINAIVNGFSHDYSSFFSISPGVVPGGNFTSNPLCRTLREGCISTSQMKNTGTDITNTSNKIHSPKVK